MKNYSFIISCVCIASPCFASEPSEKRVLSDVSTNTSSYRTCLAPYNGSYELVENNIVDLIQSKIELIKDLIRIKCINKEGEIDKDQVFKNSDQIHSILEQFWRGECCIVVEAKKVQSILLKDFNAYMDKVFEENYVAAGDYDVNRLRCYVNVLSAIFDLSAKILKMK
jgi:hypothetical protein